MKYKVKYYPDGKIFVAEKYPGIEVDIGKLTAEYEEDLDIPKEIVKEIKNQRLRSEKLKRLNKFKNQGK